MKLRLNFQLPTANLAKRFNLRPKSVTYLALGLFFLVAGFYFVIVNVVSNKGTELRTLELSNRDLNAQNQRLEVEAARLKSLQVIDEGATGKVEVGDGEKKDQDTSTTPTTTEPPKKVTFTPKMVQSKHYTYLPSYTALAQK